MNFSKVGILVILLGMSLLSACTQKTLIFSGESANWSVRYEATKGGGCRATSSGYIEYIGSEPIPEMLDYSIYHSEGTVPLEKEGGYTLSYRCVNAYEETEIVAIIKWDNKSEEIPLMVE